MNNLDKLIVRFRAPPDPDNLKDWEEELDKFPCPLGFTGPVPHPDDPPDPHAPWQPWTPPDNDQADTSKPRLQVAWHIESRPGNRVHRFHSGSEGDEGYSGPEERRTELTVRFSDDNADDSPENCYRWANWLCWRPFPLDYLNLVVTKVLYRGVYERDEALPTLSGNYDREAGTITLNEVEGEEGEPSIRIMWPTGDLRPYLRFAYHGLQPWFVLDYRFRLEPPEPIPPEDMPPMWIGGPHLPGDTETLLGQQDYGWRIPVRFTLAEGLLEADNNVDATGSVYQEFLTAADAFNPSNGQGGTIQVAPTPEPGQEPSSPGVDFTQSGLNAWVANEGPLEDTEYTLLMEILPAWGRFELTGHYLCAEEVHSFQGRYEMRRDESIFFNAPLIRKPVAYLKLNSIKIVIYFYNVNCTIGGWHDVILNDTTIGSSRPANDQSKYVMCAFSTDTFNYAYETRHDSYDGYTDYSLEESHAFPVDLIKGDGENTLRLITNGTGTDYKIKIKSYLSANESVTLREKLLTNLDYVITF